MNEAALQYRPLIPALKSRPISPDDAAEVDAPDRRDGNVYDCPPELKLAVEVALATGRPLLLRGKPGSGKSSLAPFVARVLGYRYYEHVTTATTRAQDLLWRYDTVRRLSDAQVRREGGPELTDADYVEPGVLWWAFAPESAQRRGVPERAAGPREPAVDPNYELNAGRGEGAVVLIDEIDKADPDIPNGLLGPLSSSSFVVAETGVEVARPTRTEQEVRDDPISRLLVIVTTNEERDLPPAFERRCVVHVLEHPGKDRLVEIARLHFGDDLDEDFAHDLASRVETLRAEAREARERPPSTAEYLDALRACRALQIGPDDGSASWELLKSATLRKPGGVDDEGP